MGIDVTGNLRRVQEQITRAAEDCGRNAGEVRLVAVSKTFPVETIRPVLEAGHLLLGENRVQEAEPKINALRDTPGIEWHLVGHLQSNKARRAAELFHVIHSVDSERLAARLSEACISLGRTLAVLLQVDLGHEPTKFGAEPDEIRRILDAASSLKGLRIDGLMTLPPFFDEPELARPFFSKLRQLRDALESEQPYCLGRGHLSMGMSHDFVVAIQEGATIVRIGTAIFGSRSHG